MCVSACIMLRKSTFICADWRVERMWEAARALLPSWHIRGNLRDLSEAARINKPSRVGSSTGWVIFGVIALIVTLHMAHKLLHLCVYEDGSRGGNPLCRAVQTYCRHQHDHSPSFLAHWAQNRTQPGPHPARCVCVNLPSLAFSSTVLATMFSSSIKKENPKCRGLHKRL